MSNDAPSVQDHRPLTLHTPLGPDALLVASLQGAEELSRLFRFRLDLLAPRGAEPPAVQVPFHRLLGQPAHVRLTYPDGSTRHVHGIFRRVVHRARPGDKFFYHYRAELVPTFWLWTRRVRSRVFQRQSVPDVLHTVLAGLRPNLEFVLHGTYQPRDYCVQYRESDFAFASRLMEEEGLWYYFRHEADRHVLVVTDSTAGLPELSSPLVFDETAGRAPDAVRVSAWETAQRISVSRFCHRDQHFELSGQAGGPPLRTLEARTELPDAVTAGAVAYPFGQPTGPDGEPLEVYQHSTGFARRYEGEAPGGGTLGALYDDQQRHVRLRAEREQGRALEAAGRSNCVLLTPAARFRLDGLADDAGEYLAVRVDHTARQGGFRSGDEPTFRYTNRFRARPAGVPYRPPRRTRKPHVLGVQTAIVTGAPDKAIDLDRFGRVRVQFYWDRADRYDEDSSCWVRVAQVWAGNRWGAFFWPRPGQEVVVAFEDGDPDRPLITGSVYNAANMPPYELPANAVASGIVSCSAGGDPLEQFNAVVFHDAPGDEHLQIHSETHEARTSEAVQYSWTPGGRVEFVGSLPAAAGSGGGGGISTWATAITGVRTLAGGTPGPVENFLVNYFPGNTSYYMGLNRGTTLGARATQVIGGSDVKWATDYRSIFWDVLHGGASGVWKPLGALVTMFQWVAGMGPTLGGSADVVCGPKTSQLYWGPKVDVTRCKTYTYKGPPIQSPAAWATLTPTEKCVTVGVAALVALYNLLLVVSDVLARVYGTVDAQGKITPNEWAEAFGYQLPNVCCALLLKVEMAQAETQKADLDALAALDLARAIERKLLNFNMTTVTNRVQYIRQLLDDADNRVVAGLASLEDALSTLVRGRVSKEAATESCVYQQAFTLGAPTLTLEAKGTQAAPTTSVTLQSLGHEGQDGWLTINATQTLQLGCRGATVGIQAKAGEAADELQVDLQNPRGGKIRLEQAALPFPAVLQLSGGDTGPQIQLLTGAGSLTGPVIQMGTEDVKLAVGPASLTLGLEALVLRFGTWSVTLGPAGIRLEVATQILEMTPASFRLSGMDVQESAEVTKEMSTLNLRNRVAALEEEVAALKKL